MIHNSFSKGPEGWCSYDYHASMVAGGENVFILTSWARKGGVNDGSYVWTDNTRWSADTPEKPLSILSLIFYRHWINEDPVDLRGCEVSAYLRGDNLRLDGAQCYFWAVTHGARWHYTAQPLTISEGGWADAPQKFVLHDDESRWHNSWTSNPNRPVALTDLLRNVVSYGFAFVGFSSEVTGRFALAEFSISAPSA